MLHTNIKNLKEQLRDFGLNPNEWILFKEGQTIKISSRTPEDRVEFLGTLKQVKVKSQTYFKLKDLELSSF